MAALTNDATLQDYQDLSAVLKLYMRFNGKDCSGGTGWCGLNDLGVMVPTGSFGAKLLLWPAYLGMRLSYGFWLLGPRLFGYRMRLVVDGGKAGTRLVKVRGVKEHVPAPPVKGRPATKRR